MSGGADTASSTDELPGNPETPGSVRSFQLTVVEGAPTTTWRSGSDRCTIGAHSANDLVVEDGAVSRFHCELTVDARGVRVRDLGSRNGTTVDGVRIIEVFLRSGSLLRVGRAVLRFDYLAESHRLALSTRERFGALVGSSVAMRAAMALLERAATADVTLLLEGETGTGKGAAAEAVHLESARAQRPFVVVDCGAIPGPLLESELFGHERGAFSGADRARIGAFEEASGGTVFLDEIGELSADLQPKLLRVLENREIRRLGQNSYRPVDVRVIAATHRDLRADVNSGRFRSDLYFRLAVLRVTLPALRQRPEDLELIAAELLAGLKAPRGALTAEWLANMQAAAWPGNVRELRNYLERCLVIDAALPIGETADLPSDGRLPYSDARQRALDQFERRYVAELVAAHKGKVADAAREAGVTRVYLYRLLRRHGLKP